MSRVFLTSDLHFGHNQEFIWKARGYNSIQEMDEDYICRWNATVSDEDDVYVLGDLMLGDNDNGIDCISRLNGRIHIVLGNHDTPIRQSLYLEMPNVREVEWAIMLPYKKYHFFLTHFPCMTCNYDEDKPLKARIINLCGHTHTVNKYQDMDKGLIYHCEVDAHNGYPILIDDIIQDLKNWVEVGQPRCGKCVYEVLVCGQDDRLGTCPKYKRDAPDGGFYG